ncbi:MAG: hypothetical protein IPL09_07820 [Bacteroidetes bacterium]|nr:hypothetical protein [Bacteroidota bacterium]
MKEARAVYSTIINSTDQNAFSLYYISVPIYHDSTKSLKSTYIDKEFIVMLTETLFEILESTDAVDSYDLSCKLLRTLMDEDAFYVSQKAYEQLKKYIISPEDALKYLEINSKKLRKEYKTRYSENGFLLNSGDPSYKSRCLIHHYFYHGHKIMLNCEGGGLDMIK